jgi:DNA-binding HxlR family transcriptional regulator
MQVKLLQAVAMTKISSKSYRSHCPIGRALDVIGDRWTLLIVRDLLFAGYKSYREFLASGEGIATNILADRLSNLEVAGIIKSKSDPTDGRKLIYGLTAKGTALASVLLELSSWGMKYEGGTGPESIVKEWKADPDAFLSSLAKHQAG